VSLRWNDAERTLALSVHDLLAAGARDVRRLAMSDRARLAAGVELHQSVQAERAAEIEDYRAEERVRHTVVVRGWTCTVHGRMDGVYEDEGRTFVEEIKSTALASDALAAVPGFPEWEAQLQLYVLFARAARRPDPVGLLRVVSLVDGAQRVVAVEEPPGLEAEVHARLDAWVRAREERILWRAVRRSAPVPFAHAAPRDGQAEAAQAVHDAVLAGRQLLLSAPTGVGKTAAILHGALRAAHASDLRVFWATQRTTQQAIVERTLADMEARGLRVRSVTLRAREKACLNGVVDCRPEVCPYAEGYHLRVDAALAALPDRSDAAAFAAVGQAHRVCPYELARDRSDVADVVIGDANYVFDPSVRGRTAGDDPVVLVVDEAHQLPDRAAEAASPELTRAAVDAALAMLPTTPAWSTFRVLAGEVADALDDAALLSLGEVEGSEGRAELLVEPNVRRWTDLRDRIDEVAIDHARLLPSLTVSSAEDPGQVDAWTPLAEAVLRFVDALARAGEETAALWTPERLRLVCRDASHLLGPRFAEAHAAVCTSATLAPTWFFRERCGLDPDRVVEHVVEPPFPPENRLVVAVPGISTAYRKRDRDRDALVEAIQRTVAAVPGNCAVFFGSFDQLDDLLGACDWPDREVLSQTRGMSEEARAELLERLVRAGAEGARPAVLGAVLGGIFAEGVDLPGPSLRAAIVVGPALPPPSAELALRQAWWEDRFDDGFTLASVQPGMTRVVQAAGRVVRGPEDRGAVVLLCQRFLQHAYMERLPTSWTVRKARRPWETVAAFFGCGAGTGAVDCEDAGPP
jgi:DNA excision repair protein ERCC-2